MTMTCSFKKCAMAGCMSMLAAGCASQQNLTPEYRLSSTSTEVAVGASMLQRGRAQLDAGLDALAIESFRGEIRQNPESADAYNGLAVAYGRIGRSDLAQRYFETALAKEPTNAKVQANLAKLNNYATPAMQVAAPAALKYDPSPVTLAGDDDAIGRILDSLVTPTVMMADLTVEQPGSLSSREILGKQGVLSARFAAAPVHLATNVAALSSDERQTRELPGQQPSDPKPVLPPATLPAEVRYAGTRLERVSLGEVRLVTMVDQPMLPNKAKSNFASFGDRLSVWLPQSIATEQTNRVQLPQETPVMLAAIQRAELASAHSTANIAELKELEQFAYIFFDTDAEIVAV